VSIVPILGALFLTDLWVHRQTPFAETLQARGWVYAGLAIFALVARVQRNHWLDSLDRTYFRERLNAQRLLRCIGEEIRRAGELHEVAPRVVTQMESALHAEFVALLVCPSDQEIFQTIAVSPASHLPLSLSSASKAIELVRLMRKPVQLADRHRTWMFRHLPAADVEWLSRANVETIVPIQLGGQQTEAVFALGPKRSEEPYSAEDDDLLMAIADNLAWLLRRAPALHAGRDAFQECPVCGLCFAFDTARCPNDDAVLAVASLPRVLVDRYKLERRVGRGGMGAVYAAFDRALNRDVAVKVLREDLVMPGAAERFTSEARLAAALAHRNVVTVHDIGVTQAGRAFFIMELLNGVTLREELRRAGRLRPARVLQILRDVGSGVEAAHRRQMIHRDLKPENILLCRDEGGEVAKVLDFGLAKAIEVSGGATTMLTTPGMVAGTLPYMAPEHLSGGEASSDWDLWALAVMAFEMITGVLPAAGPMRTTDLDTLPTDGLRELFGRALSNNPIDRPATVAELLDELARELKPAEEVGSGL
jgi:serine/threonine-protein kinase